MDIQELPLLPAIKSILNIESESFVAEVSENINPDTKSNHVLEEKSEPIAVNDSKIKYERDFVLSPDGDIDLDGEESFLDRERKRLEEEGRKAAISSMQTESLEEKYNKIMKQFSKTIAEISVEIRQKTEQSMKIHEIKNEPISFRINEILNTVSIQQNACKLSLNDFLDLENKLKDVIKMRDFGFQSLSTQLETIDHSRANRINSVIADYMKQLRKIKFLPKDVVTRLFQDECAATNLSMIKNRELILEYITTLRTVNLDMDHKLKYCISGFMKKWHLWRFQYLFELYDEEIKTVLEKDVNVLYQKHQKIMDSHLAKLEEMVIEITKTCAKNLTNEFVCNWRKETSTCISDQESSIETFSRELAEFENLVENEATKTLNKWRKRLKECDVSINHEGKLDAVMQERIEKYRPVSTYMAGKRAAMILPLQSGRNREILDKLSTFINCILKLKDDTMNEIQAIESETGTQVESIKESLKSDIGWMEKIFSRNISVLIKEKKSLEVSNKMAKAIDSLHDMDKLRCAGYSSSTDIIKALHDKVKTASYSYFQQLCSIFNLTDRPTSQELHAENVETLIIKTVTFYVRPITSEIHFLNEKIKELSAHVSEKEDATLKSNKKTKKNVQKSKAFSEKSPVNEFRTMGKLYFDSNIEESLAATVVEVNSISEGCIKTLRSFLQKNLLEEADSWHVHLMDQYNAKIHAQLKEHAQIRKENLLNLELRIMEVKQQAEERISSLQSHEQVYENQARIIGFKMIKIRESYSLKIKELEDLTDELLTRLNDEILKILDRAHLSSDIKLLMDHYKEISSKHKDKMQKIFLKATESFEEARHGLEKSQAYNLHEAAWDVVADGGHAMDEYIIALNQYRDTFHDRLEKIQGDIADTTNRVSMELTFNFDDLIFLEKVNRKISEFKIQVRSQMQLYWKKRLDLKQKIGELNKIIVLKEFKWDNVHQALQIIKSIGEDCIDQTKFLTCGNNLGKCISKIQILDFDEWKAILKKNSNVNLEKSKDEMIETKELVEDIESDPISLNRLISKQSHETTEVIYILARGYYESKGRTPIRRLEIPPDHDGLMNSISAKLLKIKNNISKARSKDIEEYESMKKDFDNELVKFLDRIHELIIVQSIRTIDDIWSKWTSEYITKTNEKLKEKTQVTRMLKHRLGHPQHLEELNELNARAIKIVEKREIDIQKVKNGLEGEIQIISSEFAVKMEFIKEAMEGLLQQVKEDDSLHEYLKEKQLRVRTEHKEYVEIKINVLSEHVNNELKMELNFKEEWNEKVEKIKQIYN